MRSRVSSSGECLATTSSNVAFASSIIAQSSPPSVSMPAARRGPGRPGAPRCRARQPERVGEPLRRVDRQHGDLLARARPSRPRSRRRSSSCRRRPSRRRCRPSFPRGSRRLVATLRPRAASARSPSGPSSGSKMKGSSSPGAPTSSRRRSSCSRWIARAPCSLSAARAAARAAPLAARRRQRREPLGLVVAEALGVDAVHVDAVDRRTPTFSVSSRSSRRRLVDRHLLGQGDDRDAGVAVVGEVRVERLGLGVDRADARDVGERARGLAGSRSRDRSPESRRSRGRTRALLDLRRSGCASSQILPIVTISLSPGVAAAR